MQSYNYTAIIFKKKASQNAIMKHIYIFHIFIFFYFLF